MVWTMMKMLLEKVRVRNFLCCQAPTIFAAVASVEEYMTMVAGGLAGATPHMISATVTALSRLVFEFKGMHTCPTVLDGWDLNHISNRYHLRPNAKRDIYDPSCFSYLCES